jgi:dihydrofolate reductase
MNKKVSLIVAAAENGVIGQKGGLPWHLKADMKFFKETTLGNTVIMGRTTHESIGKPLPERQNIVLSRVHEFESPGCEIAASLEDAIKKAKSNEVFIIGGESVYRQALEKDLVDKIYLTRIHTEPEGDAFFNIDFSQWKVSSQNYHEADTNNQFPFTFYILEKAP